MSVCITLVIFLNCSTKAWMEMQVILFWGLFYNIKNTLSMLICNISFITWSCNLVFQVESCLAALLYEFEVNNNMMRT